MDFRDNGSGAIAGLTSSLNYTTGALALLPDFTAPAARAQWNLIPASNGQPARYEFDGWQYQDTAYTLPLGGTVEVAYAYGDAAAEVVETHTVGALLIDLPKLGEHAVSGSLRMTFAGKTLTEQSGAVYADVSSDTGTGTWVGSLDLASRRVTLTAWTGGEANTPDLLSLLTRMGNDAVTEMTFRAPSAPVKSGQFEVRATQLDGTAISATADGNGDLTAAGIRGHIVYETGIASVRFGQYVTAAGNEGEPWYDASTIVSGQVWQPLPVYADSILYNATTETRLALPADVVGLETERLPPDGRVEIVRARDMVYIHHTDTLTVNSPASGEAVDCGRERLERVWVRDANGARVPASKYTATAEELDAGVFHWADPLDTSGYPTPWTVYHRISDGGTVGQVDRFGYLTLRDRPVTHDFPAGSLVSSVLFADTLMADWSPPFAQATWTGVWSDSLIGSAPAANYDYLNYPIVVTNQGVTIKARVALIFQDSTHFRCVIEGASQIDSGVPITADYAPINPATQVPYFVLKGNVGADEPWGTGWSAGNVLRFNLSPANFPVEVVRCLQPSDPADGTDYAEIELHGNFG
jgi:hypothetical protein